MAVFSSEPQHVALDVCSKKMRYAAILLVVFSQGLAAAAVDDAESLVKASVVYNIARFVTWPEKSNEENAADLIICIQNDNHLVTAFSDLAAAQARGDTFSLRLVERFGGQNVDCHVAVLSEDNLDQVDLSAMARDAILAVSDAAGFLDEGGSVEILNIDGKIGFSINRRIEELSGVLFSSQILQLDQKVILGSE